MNPVKYGVKLVSYGDQVFNMWAGHGLCKYYSYCKVEAHEEKQRWEQRNPKGYYVVAELKDEKYV